MAATVFSNSNTSTAPGNNSGKYTISGSNLVATLTTPAPGDDSSVTSTNGVSSGKFYWEFTVTNGTAGPIIGIYKSGEAITAFPGNSAGGYGYYGTTGNKFNSASGTAYGTTYTTGDVIGVAYNATSGVLWFSKNGTWQNSATITEIANGTTTHAAFTGIAAGTYYAGVGPGTTNLAIAITAKFNVPFSFPIPAGYTDFDGNNQAAATGVAATGSVGTVALNLGPQITGAAAAGAVGDLTLIITIGSAVGIGQVGNLIASISTGVLTGVSCAGAVGTVVAEPGAIITGVSGLGETAEIYPIPPAPVNRAALLIRSQDGLPASLWLGNPNNGG